MKTVCQNGVLGFALLLGTSATLQAGDPLDHWFSTGNAFGNSLYNRSLYGLGRLPLPPYFALHPPVYYGIRYGRPYGVSPFPVPPRVRVPATFVAAPFRTDALSHQPDQPPENHGNSGKTTRAANRARVIINPYCQPGADSTAGGVQTQSQPQDTDRPAQTGS